MRTVDYTFYSTIYRGTLDEESFSRLIVHAAAVVDDMTSGRASGELPAGTLLRVNLALCAVCDAMQLNEERGGVLSMENDGISVSYAAEDSKATGKRLKEAASVYLATTGLLYRGCCG